ncbi:hypothetical protein UFOVP435_71 [uncultured Caudovirales phage]|uniref:Uncharacterized protein n=1 Tax=uncultured Caudovirales phage TaxID=2100421 RepID=A0A6J5MDW5_9CAUD|nr:hypothetical protein UFOVP435_71 [uncultured Caudovirales phage]
MSKRTPGPWQHKKCPCGHPGCSSYYISPIQGSVGFDEADAKLLAKSPELFETLEGMVAIFTSTTQGAERELTEKWLPAAKALVAEFKE